MKSRADEISEGWGMQTFPVQSQLTPSWGDVLVHQHTELLLSFPHEKRISASALSPEMLLWPWVC